MVARSLDRKKALTYSIDTLQPGLYIWLGSMCIRLGGSEAEENYPGLIKSKYGIVLVLSGYRLISSYNGMYSDEE